MNGGGIATCVQSKDAMHTLKVFEGEDDNEIMITRHSQFVVPINVVNIYGEVESRSTKDKIQDNWSIVLNEVTKIEAKGEYLAIIGDLNKHVGGIINGNENDKISFGGQLVKDMLDTGRYVLVNATEKCKGGPYTRVDPSDPFNDDKKSVLELCIISKELFKYVETLVIDKDRKFTPFRPVNNQKMTYTDHYSLVLTMKNIPLCAKQVTAGRKVIRWNTNKEGGWDAYSELTNNNVVLEEVAEDESNEANKIMVKMDKELDRIKFNAFGKVKEKSCLKISKEIEDLQKEKNEVFSDNGVSPDDAN